ncbi:UNVERIFIED_CONTAM: hypothetical protein HDU68_010623 [Siphonaria sp. JEL0065]|nr:hypothetical protein HDU68_010623 [Siphonaria sp. JEL0065]
MSQNFKKWLDPPKEKETKIAPIKKWQEPPKSKEEQEKAMVKPPPGLLSEIPKVFQDVKKQLGVIDRDLSTAPIIMEIAHLTKLTHVNVLIYIIVAVLYVILVAANVFAFALWRLIEKKKFNNGLAFILDYFVAVHYGALVIYALVLRHVLPPILTDEEKKKAQENREKEETKMAKEKMKEEDRIKEEKKKREEEAKKKEAKKREEEVAKNNKPKEFKK